MIKSATKRKNLRLPEYDYAQPGFYFITICTNFQMPLLGIFNHQEVKLNENGKLAETFWLKIPEHFTNARIDQYQIMPDHIHGIIEIAQPDPAQGPVSLPKIIQWYKSITSHEYVHFIKAMAPSFPTPKLWQRNYFERVIRNQQELDNIRKYIQENPRQIKNTP